MEYIYAAMILHTTEQDINEENVTKILEAAGADVDESRVKALIAALEEQILTAYYTVPIAYSFGASLLSYKVEYITTEYNTFMAYGGIKYMTYNYDDYDWAQYNHDNNVDYKA